MAARAMWKGVIGFAGMQVPVKLYSGIEESGVHFRLLHDRDHAPVVQKMVDPETGREVRRDAVRKGIPVGRGRYVILTADELTSVEPAARRTIAIDRFVPASALDHAFYDRPYWLGPDGAAGRYAALVAALQRAQREGIARWVMRQRAYIGALRVHERHLMLITLRHAAEVVQADEIVTPPDGRAADPKELAMARELVGMLEGPFEPDQYRDEYRDRVLELVRRKARGEKIPALRSHRPRAVSDLTDALRKSLAAGRPMHSPPRARRRVHG